ncbi:hypothetical protein EELLY_v1c04240 [Entomoplasma ellychniae]|uniref:Uncharacterized protein n=1 Tax=Entomoplasma ellychniae TaxID=2114 RepID=A0A8E2QYF7_9MOLU|nr:hypothetical protein EELLY_v1c04240 [Entomoplasma ellychniae]
MQNLTRRIILKSILVNNIGVNVIQTKQWNGRTHKRDDSDIFSIINDLNDESDYTLALKM